MKTKDLANITCALADDSFTAEEDLGKALMILKIMYSQFFNNGSPELTNLSSHSGDLKIEMDILWDYLTSLETCIGIIKNNANKVHEICYSSEV